MLGQHIIRVIPGARSLEVGLKLKYIASLTKPGNSGFGHKRFFEAPWLALMAK